MELARVAIEATEITIAKKHEINLEKCDVSGLKIIVKINDSPVIDISGTCQSRLSH
jgi:hypothetical protein